MAMPMAPAKDDYEAQDDARTLQKAMEIHADGARKARAHKHVKKQMKSMQKLDGFMKLRKASPPPMKESDGVDGGSY